MLAVLVNCLLQVFGGMAVAALAAWASWHVFKLLRLPELGPWLVLASLFVIPGAARRPFVQMVILFLIIGALALLPVGRAWRKRDRVRRYLRKLAVDKPPRDTGSKRHLPT
ncbi:hypothetical protein [Sphingomonas oryzagri]